ncbi:MAG TPA: hypothetical protein PLG56_12130, partial [Lacunisphaera sp.]|nr:hypothetical protein [Lacunisphaera sp.]
RWIATARFAGLAMTTSRSYPKTMPTLVIAANGGARLVRARETALPVSGVDKPRPYKRQFSDSFLTVDHLSGRSGQSRVDFDCIVPT